MDITSYLLGKQASGGGSPDLSKYFNTTVSSNLNSSIKQQWVNELPKVTVNDNVTTLEYAFAQTPIKKFCGIKCNSNVTSIKHLFNSSLCEEVDVSGLNISNITSFEGMFMYCSKLISVNFGNLDTSNITRMSSMFAMCSELRNLDLSNFVTSNVNNMSQMFYGCAKLNLLDIRNFTFSSGLNCSSMFDNVPANCEIIVKSDTEKEWINTNFSRLTNVKTVEEYETE